MARVFCPKINGPVLVICGERDKLWRSCDFGDAIIARLDAHHDPFPHKESRFPEAGHLVGTAECCCYSTLQSTLIRFGGTVLGNAQASEGPRRQRCRAGVDEQVRMLN